MRGCGHPGRRSIPARQHVGDPFGPFVAATDSDQAACHVPDHVLQERVRADLQQDEVSLSLQR